MRNSCPQKILPTLLNGNKMYNFTLGNFPEIFYASILAGFVRQWEKVNFMKVFNYKII